MQNVFIRNLNKKDVHHFTTDTGLYLRRKLDKPFKKLCNIFTGANITRINSNPAISDDEYFENLPTSRIPSSSYDINPNKNNIILERYPELNANEPYIFVCNHTCPEDIETVLNIIDRNAYLILGSIESLKYNPEMYLTWLNGMIPFDILDKKERKDLMPKTERVLKTNSILIFPEGSHNYSPNKIINNLFDGPVNLSLKTGRKIVVITLLRDDKNKTSYIDVSNPIDVSKVEVQIPTCPPEEQEKNYVKALTSVIRDKMATAMFHMMLRHTDPIVRTEGSKIEEDLRSERVQDAFSKLKWTHDVFDAEYLVKKTTEEKEYEDVVRTLSNLRLNMNVLRGTRLNHREYVLKELDLDNKDVAKSMRRYWIKTTQEQEVKKLTKRR